MVIFFTMGVCDLHQLSFYGNMQSILFINVEACSDNYSQATKMFIRSWYVISWRILCVHVLCQRCVKHALLCL